MSSITEMMSDTDTKLDARSRAAVAEINQMIDQAGRMPMLLAIAHFFGWAEKDIGGILKASTEDWNGFARTMIGIAVIRLNAMHDIVERQELRFTLNGGDGQYEFWRNVSSAIYKAKLEMAK